MTTFDIECLQNYTLFAFQDDDGKVSKVELKGAGNSLKKKDIKKLGELLRSDTIVTFNGIKYDFLITAGALGGLTAYELYELSQRIIVEGVPHWKLYRGRIKEITYCDHIDIIETAPAVATSLKLYGGRLFSQRLWEYDVDWHKPLSKKDMKGLNEYCVNDLILTRDLYNKILPSIELREVMGKDYGVDLRSKSDAQIAEVVIASELGFKIDKAKVPATVRYVAPDFIRFKTPELIALHTRMIGFTFSVNQANGSVINPDWLKDTVIRLGEAQFNVGLGGIHSQESSLTIVSNDEHVMRNADVSSYYPRSIINSKMYPAQLTKKFCDIYESIVNRRLDAKAKGDKGTAETLKIVINGSFGKFGSKYSKLYAPHLLITVTFTGQLALLMLIEELELNEIPVISANTDGVEYYCPRSKVKLALKIIKRWEKVTGYTMDNDEYISLHARDVNNYVAKYDGYVKSKGAYKRIDDNPILKKNPQYPICYTAVREYINSGYPIEKTIRKCKDVAQFTSTRKVNGGATYNNKVVGKVVRWYHNGSGMAMHYVIPNKSGTHNMVPLTMNCKPMMDLTKKIPKDLDYDWYIEYAIKQYEDMGVTYDNDKSIQAVTKKTK